MDSTDPPSPPNDVYIAIVRGERFELYHDQITFDSPNYFTACFLSDFAESAARDLRLSRNPGPTLFAIIVEYLSGYPILPLSAHAIPSTMDLASAHRCLLADAQFYGLQRLCELLESRGTDVDLRWTGYANEMVNLRDVVKGTLPANILQRDDGTLVSLDSGLPPLVFAKDVVFTLLLNTAARADTAEQTLLSRRYSSSDHHLGLSIRLTSPATTTTSSTDTFLSLNPSLEASPSELMSNYEIYGYGPFCEAVQREHYWEHLDGRPMQDRRRAYIDGSWLDFNKICKLRHSFGIDRMLKVHGSDSWTPSRRGKRYYD